MNKIYILKPNSLYELWEHVSNRRKTQYKLLIILIILASLAEIFSISAVFPFLGILTAPDHVYDYVSGYKIINFLKINSSEQLMLPITILFCLSTLIAGLLRLILFWASTKLCFLTGADLCSDIYKKTLYQPYVVHINRNTSDIIGGVFTKTNTVIFNTIIPVLTLISSLVILFSILIALVVISPIISIATIVGLLLIYLSIAITTRNKVYRNGRIISDETNRGIKLVQEGLGNIRDILIDGTQNAYCKIFTETDLKLRNAQGNNTFYSQGPRYLIEAFGTILIALVAYIVTQQPGGILTAVPIVGTIALGAQRLLPVSQQIYWALSTIRGGQAALEDVLVLLNQKLPIKIQPNKGNINFSEKIEIKNISFRYNKNSKMILRNFNITIKKGSRIGIIGTTGSGKSTLLDILMGLLKPDSGSIYLDGKEIDETNEWKLLSLISHVPQSVYLADTSISENIALGLNGENIDYRKIYEVADKAQILDVIEALPEKFNTIIGERGVKLSGGQKQRLGIARALYKNAEIIIFDEATSALDNETEASVMNAIENISDQITVIIVAHRLGTLKNCTEIIDLDKLRK